MRPGVPAAYEADIFGPETQMASLLKLADKLTKPEGAYVVSGTV